MHDGSVDRHRFIEVEQGAGEEHPGGALGGVFLAAAELRGTGGVLCELLPLMPLSFAAPAGFCASCSR